MASVRVKTLPLAGLGIAYVHGGPLTLRMNDFSGDAFYRCIVALENEYVIRRKLSFAWSYPSRVYSARQS